MSVLTNWSKPID